jgi:exopolysaccharide biosynthesis polyprenyl glycosylphosphotransferase
LTQTTTQKPKVRKRSLTVSFWMPVVAGIIDVAAVTASAVLSYYLRFLSPLADVMPPRWQPKVENYVMFGIVLGIVYVVVSWSYKNYASRIRVPLEQEVGRIIRGSLLAMGVVLALIFFYREFSYSRLVFLLTLSTMIPALTVARTIFQRLQVALFLKGVGVQRIAIWGEGEIAKQVWQDFARARTQGFELVGSIGKPPLENVPSLGETSMLKNITFEHGLDMVVMSPPPGEEHRMSEVSHAAEGLPLELLYVPSSVDVSRSRIQVTEVGGRPILKLKTLPMAGWQYVVKRLLDFGFSALFLLIFWPLYGLLALIIYFDDGKPIFYKQARVGMDGREFDMIKFRTMKKNAEKETGAVWAVRNDPRTTRVGKFLRRWSLDELPQFWLVLRGHMSLVGPRPERPHFVEEFSSHIPQYLDRHRVKAGLTGWAQVCGLRGSDSTVEERTHADLYYVENWSLWLDFRILLRTISAVISGKGAM